MTLFPYGPLHRLAEGVHFLDGAWRRSPLGRRMTVIEGPAGEIAVHSAIELADADYGILDGVGRVTRILVPNSLHCSDASVYAERYPDAKVLVPKQEDANLRGRLSRVDGVLDSSAGLGAPWRDELQVLPIAGTRMGEVLFYHGASRTLITTDLVFHFVRDDFRGLTRLFMKLNGALDHFGPTRLARRYFIRDKSAFAQSLRPVLELAVERVIMSHGHIVTTGGSAKMRAAFADYIMGPAARAASGS